MGNSILVVDDSSTTLEIATKVIKTRFQSKVYTAKNGSEVIQKFSKYTVDLILMDIHLDEAKDGIDLYTEIDPHGNTPIIYMTGFKDKDIIQKAKKTNPVGFILKPFNFDQMIVTIEMCLNNIEIDKMNHKLIKKLNKQSKELKTQNQNLINSTQAIEQQKQLLKDLFFNAPVGYLILNESGHIKQANQIAADILQSSSAALQNLQFGDFLAESHRKHFDSRLQKTILSKEKSETEYALKKPKEQAEVWIKVIIQIDTYANEPQIRVAVLDITEAKCFRDDLMRSEKKLAGLYHNTPAMLHSLDSQGKIVEVSDYWLEYLGYARYEVIGKKISTFLNMPLAKPASEGIVDNFQQTGNLDSVPFKVKRKNGEEVDILMSTMTLKTKHGKIEKTYAVMTDISKKVEVERELTGALERFEAIFNQSSVGIFIVNKNRNIVQCNQKFSEIVGYSISELIGESTKIFHINEQTYKIFGNQYYSKLRNGSLNNVTYKFKRKDGKLRDCSISGNLIDSTNFDEGVIWVITDITQQMEIQRIIKYSEKKFRDLTENLSEIILILDDKLNIQFASSAIKKFLEIDPEQVKGLNFMTFVDDDDHDDLAEGFDTVIDNSDQVFNIDLKLVSRSHKKRFFECGISNMKNNRAVAGIVVTAHDITDRMDIQSKVNHMVSELEMKNLDLNFLNKELNDANATKDKFFSIIAHDLKSPFNTMVGFADLLLEDYYEFDDAERYSMVGKIYNSSMNALRLLENLLEWSQMQRGKMDYNPQKIDLYILSKQVLEQISSSAQNKHISIELSLPQNSWARIDKYMIAVVIRNLISNAIKFTPKNGSIKIRLQNKDSDYLLSVSDTGTGMTAEQIANLFFIESNVSTSGTEGEVGTGLGLILCKEFIDKHEGEIWAESQPGKGSTFYFTVPVY